MGDTLGVAEPDLQYPLAKLLALIGSGFIMPYAGNNSGNPNNRDYDVALKMYNAAGLLEVGIVDAIQFAQLDAGLALTALAFDAF